MGRQRTAGVYLAWSTNPGRVSELGGLLSLEPLLFYPQWLSGRRLTPARYAVSFGWTIWTLARRRPEVVVVINPPVLAAAAAATYTAVSRTRLVLDSHPGGFGAQGDHLSGRLQALHRFAARRAAATLVTEQSWAEVVRGWGGRPLLVHEPPGEWTSNAPNSTTRDPADPLEARNPSNLSDPSDPSNLRGPSDPSPTSESDPSDPSGPTGPLDPPDLQGPSDSVDPSDLQGPSDLQVPSVPVMPDAAGRGLRIVFLGTYGRDEPVAELFAAVAALPELTVRVTGDRARAPEGLLAGAPKNIELLGYLSPSDYQEEVARADLVVVLTTEPTSVMRAAYEAVYACRPLVTSDWPILKELFPEAVHAPGTVFGITLALRRAVDTLEQMRSRTPAARRLQLERWDAQLSALQEVVG